MCGRLFVCSRIVNTFHKITFAVPLSAKTLFFITAIGLCGICSCALRHGSITEWKQKAQNQNFYLYVYKTSLFDLVGFSKIHQGTDTLVVYIEGDGKAWKRRHLPSTDPTPTPPLALAMALLDPQPSVTYIARPGQFVEGIQARNCDVSLWTSHRFSPVIVEAMNEAVSQAKTLAGARQVDLVGYSGGGALVVLIAAKRHDVRSLRTVAGNLDHRLWTRSHKVSPLWGSLNPSDCAKAAAGFPQVHYVGGKDHIIGPQISSSFQKKAGSTANIKVQVLPGNTHDGGWLDVWPTLCREFYSSLMLHS